MERTYILKIFTSSIKDVSLILNRESSGDNDLDYWSFEINETENEESNYSELINFYSNNRKRLIESEIMTSEPEFWILYQYDQQCNLEFTHQELLELANLKLNLCISCWEGE